MHARLHRYVRVCDGGGEQLAKGAEDEGVARGDAAALGEDVAELFEDCVLQYRVYD